MKKSNKNSQSKAMPVCLKTRFALKTAIILLGILMNLSVVGQTSGFKVRALWVDPTGFETKEAVDKMISKCQRAGINRILPNIMYKDNVNFKSKNFNGNVLVKDQFDPLGYMISKAHAIGIKVEAWSCVYYTKPSKEDWVGQIIDPNIKPRIFLSPAHPDVNPYLLSVLKELLAYDIDGIHLDYTRYWNAAYDYSDAARKGCKADLGFDPINFLDHPELIVPASKDPFPIRVLHPKTQIGMPIELGHTERNMNMTETGYAFISESPKNIDALRAPGLLIIDYYKEVSPEMASALNRYVNRGGNILWMNLSNTVLASNPVLQKLTGIGGAEPLARGRVTLEKTGNHAISRFIPAFQFSTSGNIPEVTDATIISRLSTGEPAITIKQTGKSSVMVIGFNAMEISRDSIVGLMKGIMNWYRAEAGVKSPDLLAEKRNQWVNWRAEQILPLVREISKAVKEKNPNLVVTSCAGVGPQQTHGIYREGGYWLSENINDYLYPMNYTDKPIELVDILDEQETHTPKGLKERIYPGLRLYTWKGKDAVPNDAKIIEQQLLMVQKRGYQGFCLFCARDLSEEIIEVVNKFSR